RVMSICLGFLPGSILKFPSLDFSPNFTESLSPRKTRRSSLNSFSGASLPPFWAETTDQVPANFLRSPLASPPTTTLVVANTTASSTTALLRMTYLLGDGLLLLALQDDEHDLAALGRFELGRAFGL